MFQRFHFLSLGQETKINCGQTFSSMEGVRIDLPAFKLGAIATEERQVFSNNTVKQNNKD